MNTPRLAAPPQSNPPSTDETKSGFRTKTVATRLTPDELAEIESSAQDAGQALSEWLRAAALSAARQRPADPVELLLAEVWALRYVVLNFFHAGTQAASEGKQMLPDSVLKIRDQADARKPQQASRMLEEFLARKVE